MAKVEPIPHRELIHQWADGYKICGISSSLGKYSNIKYPAWHHKGIYRLSSGQDLQNTPKKMPNWHLKKLWADGYPIQQKNNNSDVWFDVRFPDWAFEVETRSGFYTKFRLNQSFNGTVADIIKE